ncbi:2-C-methyl-D-erythritol 2,4-cyclodiphosphate synthase [Phosphitispora sp. TUW77]|uniref:2-C-methyl-D-erythritol 2,4-cyclodiphosphate synthase n=1 Tax=Phosphitispora sp. TUW77 TaxID=3152361 RepID=UPI003AB45562
MRFGVGYDAHRLVMGRELVLGGVAVPFEKGLEGHSDADVLAHSIMDALLGAAGQGDIGRHFPDTEDKYKGISSLVLLEQVTEIICEHGYQVNNVDSVIVAQRPKLAPYISLMTENLARAMRIPVSDVNVKATTTEGMGFAGSGEGIAAYAVAGIKKA